MVRFLAAWCMCEIPAPQCVASLMHCVRGTGSLAGPAVAFRSPHPVEDVLSGPLDSLAEAIGVARSQSEDEEERAELASWAIRAGGMATGVRRLLAQEVPGGVYYVDGMDPGSGRGPRPAIKCTVIDGCAHSL